MNEPRNYFIKNAEINWAKLARPVNPFGTEVYELQVATTDASQAEEWKANHLSVKEKDGKYTVSLRRKTKKADGSDNGKVKVFNKDLTDFEDVGSIGNGTIGNVKVFQFPYEAAGRKGISTSLTAVQLVDLKVYQQEVGFEAIVDDEPSEASADDSQADLF